MTLRSLLSALVLAGGITACHHEPQQTYPTAATIPPPQTSQGAEGTQGDTTPTGVANRDCPNQPGPNQGPGGTVERGPCTNQGTQPVTNTPQPPALGGNNNTQPVPEEEPQQPQPEPQPQQ